ncbi:hypothetical protein PS910_04304 [Pseudomonas fluorescens]|nr:hypothetical protein PS910_04304 [Pseudomonas fluorescens]
MVCLRKIEVSGMMDSNKLRAWLSTNLAPVVFLCAYFFTVVLGSFMYLMPSARPYLDMARFTSRIFEFDTLFSTGYWLLLLSPFVVTPLIVWLVRRVAQRPLQRVIDFFPEFTRTSYLVLLVMAYALVLYSFWHADAFKLFLAGGDFASSIEARFEIRERVSFFSMAVLMSNLHFLSIYSAVKWVREGGYWWGGVTIVNAVLVSILLVSLNMKWPIIIFYAGMVMAIFVYTRRYPFIKTAVGMVVLLLVYFMISAFVYRLSPAAATADSPVTTQVERLDDQAEMPSSEDEAGVDSSLSEADAPAVKDDNPYKHTPPEFVQQGKDKSRSERKVIEVAPDEPSEPPAQSSTDAAEPSTSSEVPSAVPDESSSASSDESASAQGSNEAVSASGLGSTVVKLGTAVGEHVPMMMFHAVNRMAIIYPYYYEIFTTKGQVCGGLLAQAQVGQKCRPSYYIYTDMFDDQFNGRGTAPAAVHITAYALGGWPLAAVGLVCASLLLGIFASLPLSSNSIVGSMAITGGVVGYHLSQLPGEGPLFYDHGVFWTVLMLLGYAVLVKLHRRIVS